ncbi:carboxylesterase 5A-like [Engraulis encrasicolus]|uniref:carboxylesterase 5A-like n=1 Tax=Engraulis encrasicolus TaxID=184585 RepID=UPI002FD0C1F6
MAALLLYVCVTLSAFGSSLSQSDSAPVVSVKNGTLRGASMSVKGSDKLVQQYLGIPFARPPLGNLRFAPPEPAESWEGERDATQQPNVCLQVREDLSKMSSFMGIEYTVPAVSEDCLYLNIYTPAKPTDTEKLPVFLWIHGGGFRLGAASQYDGSILAAYENMVVVIVQYRLDMLGFLSVGDEQNPEGNWGFLDQLAALKWVQENIESFGGDPNSVTIAGQSVGGESASFLVLSPLSKGLFHRVILQSAVATVSGPYTHKRLNDAKMKAAKLTGCDPSSAEVLVKCLREKTEEELLAAMKQHIPVSATVDGKFLTAQAEEVLKSKDFLKVPVLLGATNNEVGWQEPEHFLPRGWEKGIDRATLLDGLKGGWDSGATPEAYEIMIDEYLKDAKTPEEARDASLQLLGDSFFIMPVILAADYFRDAGVPVFLYEFQHPPEMQKARRPSFVKADHTDDLPFMFGACFWNGHVKLNGTTTEEENQLCKTMMSYWGNFARSGNPT